MFPPTLKGNADGVNVAPVSVEIRICPLLGSHELVYIPVAYEDRIRVGVSDNEKIILRTKYSRFGWTGSVAKASTPQ